MRRNRLLCLLLALTLTLSGCAAAAAATAAQEEKNCQLYYLVRDLDRAAGGDAIAGEVSTLPKESDSPTGTQAEELMNALLSGPAGSDLQSPFPEGTRLLGVEIRGSHAKVDLSSAYRNLSGIDLTLADYCVTLTLSQLPGVSVVRITVEGQELAYRSHSLLRSQDLLMTSEDDVSRTLAIRLYFPAQSTGQLTPESRTLTLHEGDSSAEAIVSALLAGPQADGLSPLLPDGFQVLTVRVESGTCYLNLPRSDVSLLPEGQDAQELLVRGMVNSLCSIASVDRVQLLLDGEVAASLGQIDISGPLCKE